MFGGLRRVGREYADSFGIFRSVEERIALNEEVSRPESSPVIE